MGIRKGAFLIALIILVYYAYQSSNHPYVPQVRVSTWNSTLEPDPESNDPDIHRLRFEYTIENDGKQNETVETVRPTLKGSFISRVQTSSYILSVNKTIKPQASIKMQGDFKVKMDGLTDKEVNLAGGIERFEIVLKKRKFWFF